VVRSAISHSSAPCGISLSASSEGIRLHQSGHSSPNVARDARRHHRAKGRTPLPMDRAGKGPKTLSVPRGRLRVCRQSPSAAARSGWGWAFSRNILYAGRSPELMPERIPDLTQAIVPPSTLSGVRRGQDQNVAIHKSVAWSPASITDRFNPHRDLLT
jgi:hypothetical protein